MLMGCALVDPQTIGPAIRPNVIVTAFVAGAHLPAVAAQHMGRALPRVLS